MQLKESRGMVFPVADGRACRCICFARHGYHVGLGAAKLCVELSEQCNVGRKTAAWGRDLGCCASRRGECGSEDEPREGAAHAAPGCRAGGWSTALGCATPRWHIVREAPLPRQTFDLQRQDK